MASHGLRYGIELACTSLSIPSSEKGPNGGLMNDEVGASQCRISRQCRTAASGAAAVRSVRSPDPRDRFSAHRSYAADRRGSRSGSAGFAHGDRAASEATGVCEARRCGVGGSQARLSDPARGACAIGQVARTALERLIPQARLSGRWMVPLKNALDHGMNSCASSRVHSSTGAGSPDAPLTSQHSLNTEQ